VQEGFVVIAHDARAHGKTAERATPPGIGCVEWGTMGALRLVEDMKELIKLAIQLTQAFRWLFLVTA